MMAVKYDNEIDALLNAAEQHRQCLARPKDKHLMRALAYRSNHAKPRMLLSPHCGVYVRRTYWKGLSRRDQVLHIARAIAQLHPKWIFDSYTAAAIRGWNVSYELLDKLNILAPYQIQAKSIISRSASTLHLRLSADFAYQQPPERSTIACAPKTCASLSPSPIPRCAKPESRRASSLN